MKTKQCTKCLITKDILDFPKNKKGINGIYCQCKSCHNLAGRRRFASPEARLKVKGNQLRRYWPELAPRARLEKYAALLREQNGLCAICFQSETIVDGKSLKTRDLAVDHSHLTGKTRGLLCTACNISLGKLKENIETFQSAIAYLKRHTGEN